ncbi:MAG TPA: carboxypeptidase-like regulatory domain-containing protein, partial [Longimicrobiales bacterium]|nr:carboxypeptidase-like regulatory domain-containing protein [Longimicrobiales bacterium]
MRDLCRVLAVAVALLTAPMAVAAQQGSVTGRVTDASTGEPLGSAQIFVQGTNIGTLSTAEGRYLLTGVAPGERRISAVLIGYGPVTQTVTVTADATAPLDFQLAPSAIALDEVVVTATGEQRKVEIGNALGSINAEDVIEAAPITNLSDLLKGRSAGVVVGTPSG